MARYWQLRNEQDVLECLCLTYGLVACFAMLLGKLIMLASEGKFLTAAQRSNMQIKGTAWVNLSTDCQKYIRELGMKWEGLT